MNFIDRLRQSRISVDRPLIPDEPAASDREPENQRSIPVPPSALKRFVVYPDYVSATELLTVYVDARHVGTAPYLTWFQDLCRVHPNVKIQQRSAQELEELRQEFASRHKREEEKDQQTLNKAWRLFADCAEIGATDMHLLIGEQTAQIQVRVKGELKVVENHSMYRDEGEALARSIYSGLATVRDNAYKPLEFQNAQIKGSVFPGAGLSSIRIIRGPSYPVEEGGAFLIAWLQGERTTAVRDGNSSAARPLVLRVPDIPAEPVRLATMGFTGHQMELFEEIIRLPYGITFITGPTGSGKTTTLYEAMRYQAQLFPGARQITAEDPIEYPQPWAIQLQGEGGKFQDRVASMLRMDPEIMLIGEVRQSAEGVSAIQAALTGHFVWATVHVNDPYEVFTRLEVMDPALLPRALTCNHTLIGAITAQRVVAKLCPACSQPLAEHEDVLPGFMRRALASWGDLSLVKIRGNGCEKCEGDAVVGQQAVAEMVLTSEELMDDFLTHGEATARRNHRRKPGSDKSMLSHAMDLVLAGHLDPRDAHRGVDKIEFKDKHQGDAE